MTIGNYLMLQLDLEENFGCQRLEWNETVVLMKETGIFLDKKTQLNMK